jgi:hypothetical protein
VSPTGADGETTKTVLASVPATTRNRTNLPYASQEGKGKPGLPLPREFQRDTSENLDSTTGGPNGIRWSQREVREKCELPSTAIGGSVADRRSTGKPNAHTSVELRNSHIAYKLG